LSLKLSQANKKDFRIGGSKSIELIEAHGWQSAVNWGEAQGPKIIAGNRPQNLTMVFVENDKESSKKQQAHAPVVRKAR
jgi:hypothetical protein